MTPQLTDPRIDDWNHVVTFTVTGSAHSKANSRRLVHVGGMSRFIKSAPALKFEDQCKKQIPALKEMLDDAGYEVGLVITMFYENRRRDMDESILLDCMQEKIYKNDRCVVARWTMREIDKQNPRVEVQVFIRPSRRI